MKSAILVVDDELNILKALERMLRRSGYQVFSANNAKEALVLLAQHEIKVIITDFRMPEINGAEFLKLAKIQAPTAVPIILSAYADFNSVVAVLNEGLAFKFLQKPWMEEQLLSDVKEAFNKYENQRQNHLRTQLLIGSKDALIEFEHFGRLTRFNAAAQNLLGLTAAELQHLSLHSLFPGLSEEQTSLFLERHILSVAVSTAQGKALELIHQLSDESHYLLRLEAMQPVIELNEQFTDIPEVLDQSHIVHEIDHHLSHESTPLAVVYLDIRDFTGIHHSLGFQGADQLVAMVGNHLLEQVKGHGKLAYLYADQFIILLNSWQHEAEIQDLIHNMLGEYQQPQIINDKAIHIRFNLGYSIAPDDGQSGKNLIHQARQAARNQQQHPQHIMLRYDQRFIASRKLQYEISNALYSAIQQNQLSLAYQAKLSLNDCKVSSAEVLLRWHHPELGNISPAIFIPIAERDGQIQEIGWWVIRQTLKQLNTWAQSGLTVPQLAINVSAIQFQEHEFADKLIKLVAEYECEPQQLQLELTETALMQHLELGSEKLQMLRAAGFTIAIDDFGTGYSSLSYLTKLPIDVVKLDRSLIHGLEHSLATQSMARNIIRMSHELGIEIVAEGIETKEQHKLLSLMDCDYAQGYLYNKPSDASVYFEIAQQQPFLSLQCKDNPHA